LCHFGGLIKRCDANSARGELKKKAGEDDSHRRGGGIGQSFENGGNWCSHARLKKYCDEKVSWRRWERERPADNCFRTGVIGILEKARVVNNLVSNRRLERPGSLWEGS